MTSLETVMDEIGQQALAAAKFVAHATDAQRNDALLKAAAALRNEQGRILAENEKDMSAGRAKGLSAAMLDRLLLDAARIEAMAAGLEAITQLPDPLGQELAAWDRPNGLHIRRVSVPLGIIGIIYESRPNVTADASALCLKSGNVAILRGGSESFYSSQAILSALQLGFVEAGFPEASVQLIPTTDREAVGYMLKMDQVIDVIIPRGGRGLIERVAADSRIPVLKHLDGLCHCYIHEDADAEIAVNVPFNAKMRRTGICGATETILIDKAVAETFLPPLLMKLFDAGCEVRGDALVQSLDSKVIPAIEQDWHTEYLDKIVSIKTVASIEEAIDHINQYGSHHTDAIMTENAEMARLFQKKVDSGIVLVNASTQFADGGEFGMGAEIGISTGKLHARGPVGAAQLTSYKYLVDGAGQTRPV